jgi:GNAT superfamily N-acetyltransferase
MERSMIRMATEADEAHIQYLADRQAEELEDRFQPVQDRDNTIEVLKQHGDRAVIFLAFDGDTPVGWIGGYLGKTYYDKRVFATIDPLYVVPEARGRIYAYKLVRTFENWASKYHIHAIAIGVTSPAAKALMAACGYAKTEIVYTKETNQ